LPVPPWVRNVPGYWDWLDRLIIESAGYLDLPALVARPLVRVDGSWAGVVVETQRVHFHDGTFLSFHVVATEDFQLDSYSFHFQFDDGRLIWRKDNSPGHEEEVGQLEHIHRESEDKEPEPFPEVDLEEALEEVRQWQADRTMP
jgi:hypothetical protein